MSKIIGVQQDKTAHNKAAADSGMKARGEAIATLMVQEVQQQAGKLVRFLKDIAELDQAGRKAFRVSVQHHLKEIRRHVEATKGTPEHALYAATARSAGVRLSEASTFSKACDAGYAGHTEGMGYHAAVSAARVFLKAESAVGPTQTRGRKPLTAVQKVEAYIARLGLKTAELRKVEQVVHAMAEGKGKPAPKTENTNEAPVAKRATGSVVQMPRRVAVVASEHGSERAAAAE